MPWPFYTASEKRIQGLQSRVNDLQGELTTQRKAFDLALARIDSLEMAVQSLASQHERLRGAFYGQQGGRPNKAAGVPAGSPRDQLRALAGIRAGKPYPHTNESEE